jgi:biopolymer transport protein TolR
MPKLEPIPSVSSRGGRRARTTRVSSSLAEINVVPLVDVMLVLLVIFMVAAPMMKQGFEVDLPQSRRAQPVDLEPVTVAVPATFRRDRRVYIDDQPVAVNVLAERMRQAIATREKKDVNFRVDGAVQMNDVFTVIDELTAAGVTGLGFESRPLTRR